MGLGGRLGTLAVLALVGCSGVVGTVAGPPLQPSTAQAFPRSGLHEAIAPQVASRAPAAELAFEAPAPSVPPPTWATLYGRYFAPGTAGSCGRSRGCHAEVMADADSAYQWLAQRGYISGAQSALVGSNSCLRWFGGNMPPRGTPSEDAIRDLSAWAAAGAQNN